MSVNGLPAREPTLYGANSRSSSIRDRMLLTLVLYALVRGGEALAGEIPAIDDSASKSSEVPRAAPASAAMHAPLMLSLDRYDNDLRTFSATEFRPRTHAQSDFSETSRDSILGDKASFEGTVWQRMAEYKSQDRVRLLTLWQTRGSTLSLQAGKRGGPSLQWSSPWMMRDGATKGLFDRLLSVPLRGISNGSRNAAVRPAPEPGKQPVAAAAP
jgi:hypothetical protein